MSQMFTYQLTVTVPDDTDAGEPSMELADAIETVVNTHPEWEFGNVELSAVDGVRL